jgi:hypothetical protein
VGCNASGSSIVLDLGDSTWQGVEIQAAGWQGVERPDVHFRRSAGQQALPVPARDGSIALLRKFINVDPADLLHLVGWLTAALRSMGPHPILFITGQQGSAKSTLARICRLLVDPHSTPLLAEPKDHRDLIVAALHGWVQAYDKLIARYTGYRSLTKPGWPKSPSIASAELRRIAPQLRMFGVSVTFERS